MTPPLRARLPDGRLHLQHGPIDVLIGLHGSVQEIERAEAQAWKRFGTVLEELVAELPLLRAPVGAAAPLARGATARRMVAAVWPHREVFVTPMAAVAGAVADELLGALLEGRRLAKAIVNDGGDIAFHLDPGESLAAGLVADLARPALDALAHVDHRHAVRGIATSGWRGRSQSLGIADAVTVLARSAAQADAAATLVANAIDVDHPAIERRPARSLKEDSDLGERPVTVAVGALPREAIAVALDRGLACAGAMLERGLIEAAWLSLGGETRVANGLDTGRHALPFRPLQGEERRSR